jgi:succinate dehydrogenase/fumarate reductase-like Fe-S protein
MGPIRRFKGDLYLAYRALVAHPLKRLFSTDERSGKQRFLDNYAPEGLVPISAEDRRILQGAARCIHCGLCEAYDLARAAVSRTVYDGASLLPIAYSRATPDLPRARAALISLREDNLARSEAVCPTRVPLRSIARYLQRKMDEVIRQQHRSAVLSVKAPVA